MKATRIALFALSSVLVAGIGSSQVFAAPELTGSVPSANSATPNPASGGVSTGMVSLTKGDRSEVAKYFDRAFQVRDIAIREKNEEKRRQDWLSEIQKKNVACDSSGGSAASPTRRNGATVGGRRVSRNMGARQCSTANPIEVSRREDLCSCAEHSRISWEDAKSELRLGREDMDRRWTAMRPAQRALSLQAIKDSTLSNFIGESDDLLRSLHATNVSPSEKQRLEGRLRDLRESLVSRQRELKLTIDATSSVPQFVIDQMLAESNNASSSGGSTASAAKEESPELVAARKQLARLERQIARVDAQLAAVAEERSRVSGAASPERGPASTTVLNQVDARAEMLRQTKAQLSVEKQSVQDRVASLSQ